MYKEYRTKRKITQEKLAELINIDIRSYQDIESKKSVPLVSTFAKIVFALDISNEDIIKQLKEYSKISKKKGKKNIE